MCAFFHCKYVKTSTGCCSGKAAGVARRGFDAGEVPAGSQQLQATHQRPNRQKTAQNRQFAGRQDGGEAGAFFGTLPGAPGVPGAVQQLLGLARAEAAGQAGLAEAPGGQALVQPSQI